ncbi:MAG: methyltransferase domain-containing protein [Polyangiaceae bacterium]|nr:methyltransferase domain-containing protein [Polyangiaceae bacterium]
MRRRLLPIVLVTACGPPVASTSADEKAHGAHGHGQHAHGQHAHGGAHHDFSDAARWSAVFDDPAREAWQKPDEVVKLLAIEPGMTVVDVGAGTGYFEKRLSVAAGPSGKVLALDPEPNLVAFMRDRFQKEGVTNAEARTCPTDGTGLEPASVDRVLIVDTWHHIEGRESYAKHLASILRPGGSVMIVDYTLEAEKGPPKEIRLGPDQVVRELSAGGLKAAVAGESLPDQYVAIATK